MAAVVIRGSLEASACEKVSSRADQAVDDDRAEADVRAVFSTGWFDDVAAVVEEGPSGAVLVLEVKERPRVRRLDVVGAPRAASLADALGERGARLDPVWLRAAEDRVLLALRQDGYRNATVGHEVKPAGVGEVTVVVQVGAGPRYTLGSVRIEGLSKAPEGLVRKDLAATPGEPVPDALIERDGLVVTAALYEVGLIEGSVATRVEENRLASKVDVVFTVTEGPVYSLDDVRITGSGALAASRYATILAPLRRGSVFSRSRVAAAVQAIEALHQGEGEERRVDVSTRLDAAKHTVDLDLVVK